MSIHPTAKIILGCFLFFYPLLTSAQHEEDSVYDEDSVMVSEETTTDTTAEGEYQEKKDKEKKIWFLKKHAYNGDSLALQRNVPDSVVKKMQEDDNFWYANAIIKKKKTQQEEPDADPYVPIGQRSWFQTLIWLIIIGGFATFLLIYLSGSNIGLFRRKNKISNAGEEEVATEDIFAINYQKEIDKAASVGNYRLAIRLMFLRVLKNMSEKNIIRYQQDKTNFDYLLQLHSTKHYNNFFRITRNYEYSWYGKFEVSEEAYRIISNDFNHFENGLSQV